MAIPLSSYLSESGVYEGFDVVKKGITWCQENISTKFSNFNFTYIPIENDLYTSSGLDASAFNFPYKDMDFDCAAVISVFTHMLPDEVENYINELHRVLKKDGKALCTFFLLNESTIQSMKKNKDSGFHFPYDYGHYRLMDKNVKSANVAYDEKFLKAIFQKVGFKIEYCFYGYWRGLNKEDCHEFQDLLLVKKER